MLHICQCGPACVRLHQFHQVYGEGVNEIVTSEFLLYAKEDQNSVISIICTQICFNMLICRHVLISK